jgi:hypothetical protein
MSYSGLKDKLAAAHGTALSGTYWSSTGRNFADVNWTLGFDGSDATFGFSNWGYSCGVRGCLAF